MADPENPAQSAARRVGVFTEADHIEFATGFMPAQPRASGNQGRVREDAGRVTFFSRGRLSSLADSLELSLPNPSCDRCYACERGHTRPIFQLAESALRSSARVRARPSVELSNTAATYSSTPAAAS